ncbi:transcription factor ABORTED MICROSPORES isoform X2 [Euphorbia lathyris]|uniref:transcription factor ABORTED MICROSPORES isoform X2 n=1 Tax=Euphorbia lathyris TaxID=212925 RepID=UPI0033137D26
MNLIQKLMERLRTLVGVKGWDYCVLWILSDDQRYIEWMDCCCGGTDTSEMNGGDQIQFQVSPCRDVMFQHQRTKSCELLAHLPSSMPLDSGIHAQTLLSNQPRWFNFSNAPDLSVNEGTVGTRALIPVPGGLIELFVAKQVSEDQNIIDYVTSQCSILMEQEAIINSNNMDANFSVNDHENEDKDNQMMINNNKSNEFQQPPISPAVAALESLNLSHDISASSMNFLHQFNYSEEHLAKNHDHDHIFFEGNKEKQENDCLDSIKQENGKSDYISDCSDQIDDENDGNGNNRRRNNGKVHGAKNLVAERNRRKRLNGRLYDLRALVPKITSLNKAAILGDAIDFVNELKQTFKELEAELQENSDGEDCENGNMNKIPQDIILNQDHGGNGFHVGSSEVASYSKLNHKTEATTHHHDHNKGQQMEVQVEVAQINGNEFYVNVFSEHKAGGFVRLMEALDSLGLEVKNVNVTSCLGLVSNIFKVEKKDNEMVQADYVREFLLELTRDPPKGWHEMGKPPSDPKSTFTMDHI